jgi:nucleoside-diphosphate-sugar epimerase
MQKPADLPVRAKLLLLGFGQINLRVAKNLSAEFDITAVSRVPKPFTEGTHLAIDLVSADLSPLGPTDYMVFCLSPASYDEQNYRQVYVNCLNRVIRHFNHFPPKRLLFVSSTSVYGQNEDEIIDENSPTEPTSYNGKILVEAEHCLQNSTIPATIVRFSGIYGHHRTGLLEQIRKGNRSSVPPSSYTNRISEDDAVGALCHLLRLASSGVALANCYLASDNEPVRLHEVTAWVRRQIPCKPETGNFPPTRAGSRRCNNQRLRNTGYSFLHPTYKEGYGEIIAALQATMK